MKSMLRKLQAWWSGLTADGFTLEVMPAQAWLAAHPAVAA
jgi:hypothetical protein